MESCTIRDISNNKPPRMKKDAKIYLLATAIVVACSVPYYVMQKEELQCLRTIAKESTDIRKELKAMNEEKCVQRDSVILLLDSSALAVIRHREADLKEAVALQTGTVYREYIRLSY